MTGPTGGDSPLTTPEAIVAAARDAVTAAVATHEAQQSAARKWMTAGFPAEPAAHPVGPANAPNQ